MIQQAELKLKQIRELKNLTQEHIASQLGLSTRAYSKIESGETQLTITRLNEISKILEVDPMEVLGFDHQQIFNNCSQEGNQNTIGTTNYYLPEKLIEQYEQRIKQLESEVVFLRSIVK